MALPASMMLRMRYNPFYAGLEKRALEWLELAEAERAEDPLPPVPPAP